MINTSLCYVKWCGNVLIFHRTKKDKDINKGKCMDNVAVETFFGELKIEMFYAEKLDI